MRVSTYLVRLERFGSAAVAPIVVEVVANLCLKFSPEFSIPVAQPFRQIPRVPHISLCVQKSYCTGVLTALSDVIAWTH